ncbi:hypothetical protein OESDEN_05077 [Oesophagostomum dentatum]|uniref:Transposase n=1 Tax=Oesophagostomum dentatum TaxID=61180 RepID=A0A0B1THU5_OESDE|nr:hypothetical protein OESDEN_05077 [Oesophagostomum dentatum]
MEGSDDGMSDIDFPVQDRTALKKYFLVEGEQLLQLFQFCPRCGHKIRGEQSVVLQERGTTPIVRYICEQCRGGRIKTWEREGQKRAVEFSCERIYKGNLQAAVAAIITGLRYTELERWARQLGLALFSKTTFWQYFEWTKKAVDKGAGGLNLASDGAYDSRGYSALIVNSLTTDRSRSITQLLKQLSPEIGKITHFYDGWHMVKWVGNKLREESKSSGCAPIAVWSKNVKTFFWKSIKAGAGQGNAVRYIFNTCLMHVRGVHSWTAVSKEILYFDAQLFYISDSRNRSVHSVCSWNTGGGSTT